MPAALIVILMLAPLAVSGYFSYVGGITGRPETRMLHPVGLGTMVISLIAAVVLSFQMNIWTSSTFIVFQIFTIIWFVVIAVTPLTCYESGQGTKQVRDEAAHI